MNPDFRTAIIGLGAAVVFVGGVGIDAKLGRMSADAAAGSALLADAGAVEPLRAVVVCDERLSQGAVKRLERDVPGSLRPQQKYARVARVALCAQDAGACLQEDGGVPVALQLGDLVIPSLRRLERLEEFEEGAESIEVAASYPFASTCSVRPCADFPGLCTDIYGVRTTVPECVVPNCWREDGGWNDNAIVDCQRRVPEPDGGASTHYLGCNVMPKADAVGSQCVPVSCGVVAGEPSAWL